MVSVVSVVNTWESLRPENYLNEELQIVDRTERGDLGDIFRISSSEIEQLSSDEVSEESILKIARVADTLFHRFDKWGIDRLFNCFCRRKNAVTRAYNGFEETLASKFAEKYKGRLFDLIEKRATLEDTKDVTFIKKAIDKAVEKIKTGGDAIGLGYKVTNKHNITSTLMGTIHVLSPALINAFIFPKHTNSAEHLSFKELIVEADESNLNKSDIQRELNKLGFIERMKIVSNCIRVLVRIFAAGLKKKSLDAILIEGAKEWNIPVIELESCQDQISMMFTDISRRTETEEEKKWCKEREKQLKNHDKYTLLEIIDAWKNGDEKQIELILSLTPPRNFKTVITERNQKWLSSGLLEKLHETHEELLVAVGFGHCVGEDGLVTAFKSSGLTVEKIDV